MKNLQLRTQKRGQTTDSLFANIPCSLTNEPASSWLKILHKAVELFWKRWQNPLGITRSWG